MISYWYWGLGARVDLTMSCDSWDSNAAFDVVPRPDADDPLNPVACYLGWGESMKKYVTHPYASPLFGDFKVSSGFGFIVGGLMTGDVVCRDCLRCWCNLETRRC